MHAETVQKSRSNVSALEQIVYRNEDQHRYYVVVRASSAHGDRHRVVDPEGNVGPSVLFVAVLRLNKLPHCYSH